MSDEQPSVSVNAQAHPAPAAAASVVKLPLTGSASGGNIEQELAVLIADYSATRDDQRQVPIRDATLIGTGIAIFVATYLLVAEHEQFLVKHPLLAVAVPLAPYVIAQTYVFYFIDNVLKGYYVRALERAIQQRLAIPSSLGHGIRFPSIGHLTFVVAAARYAGPHVLLFFVFGTLAVAILYGGSALFVILTLPTVVDKIAGLVAYGSLAGVLVWTMRSITVRARRFYWNVFQAYEQAFAEPLNVLHSLPSRTSTHERPGWHYLLLPRPADLIKLPEFILPWGVSLAIFSVLHHYDSHEILRRFEFAGLFLLVFELLVYQARYQWNDLRGAAQDRAHVAADLRRRLPEGWERSSLAVLLSRLLLAAYFIHLVFRGTPLLGVAYMVAALPFVIAIPYEALRSASDAGERVWVGSVRLVHGAIYLVIGFGFAIRVLIGVLIGGAFDDLNPIILTTLFLACFFAGSAETVVVWAIESAVEHVLGQSNARPHVAILYQYIAPRVNRSTTIREQRLLRERDVFRSPWTMFHLASVVFATLFGLQLSDIHPSHSTEDLIIAIGVVVVSLAAAGVLKFTRAEYGLLLMAVGSIVVVIVLGLVARPLTAASPLAAAVIIVTNLACRRNSYNDFTLGARQIASQVISVGRQTVFSMLRWIFGDRMAIILFGDIASKDEERGRPEGGDAPSSSISRS